MLKQNTKSPDPLVANFEPAKGSPRMRFQARDEHILRAIYDYGGVLAKRQLKEMFWPDKTWRAMEVRLSKLNHSEYLDWPTRQQRRINPIPEPICWLGWRGASRIASGRGIKIEPPNEANENQLRNLERQLRNQGIRWMREPRWIQLQHDLAVVDFRRAIEQSISEFPRLSLDEWINEGTFRAKMDVVEYEVEDRNGRLRKMKKGVCPDAYFVIVDENRLRRGEPHKARFLVEIDMSTHDNPSFGIEKSAPGAAYLRSSVYKERFGSNAGRWLVVVAGGHRRMQNLLRQTEERAGDGAAAFSFTTFDDLRACSPCTSPIWWQVGSEQPIPLLPEAVQG